MSAETVPFLIFAFIGVALFFGQRWNDASRARLIAEFEAQFPGQCLICSAHEYGRLHGTESEVMPRKHACRKRETPLFDPSGGER